MRCSNVSSVIATHLEEEVDKVWVLLQFGTDYTEELNLFVFCRSSQHISTQTDQFLSKEFHSDMGKKVKDKLHNLTVSVPF